MGTPFTSEPHCLGEDSWQGHLGYDDRITDGETEAQTGEADPNSADGMRPNKFEGGYFVYPELLACQTD